MKPSIWRVRLAEPPRAQALARALKIHPLTAQLLLNRGVSTQGEGARFLSADLEQLSDPLTLPEMDRAIARLRQAISRGEPIFLFGDSDVDGLSAGVILYEALRECGAAVGARQSNRVSDGYGLPQSLVRWLCRSGKGLLVLVDCGTNQPDEIRLLAESGIESLIIDHHVPLAEPARPYALVNPHAPPTAPSAASMAQPAPGKASGLGRELCSAGLAFKVAQALFGPEAPKRLEKYLDLAALGTLADCMPLVGDNRLIVTAGLPRIIESRRIGLRRLCEATQTLKPEPEFVIRRLVPRLNASGRLGDPACIWQLLLADESRGLDEWLTQAEAAHERTKELHRRILIEAEEQVSRMHFRDQYVLLVSRSGWHPGLMGALASQLSQRYGRPTIAIAMEEEQGTGSGRSVAVFNLLEALRSCGELLVRFGGHAQACGLTVDRKHLESFRVLVNEHAKRFLGRDDLLRSRTVDLELSLGEIEPRWVGEAERLSPFGQGNPRPTVVIRHLAIEASSPRIACCSDGRRALRARGRFEGLVRQGRYDVVATPSLAGEEVVLRVSELRRARPLADFPSARGEALSEYGPI